MLKLKICGLTDPNNINEIIELKPDQMGFIFYKNSVRSVLNKNLQNTIKNIPPNIKKVGVFVDLKPQEVQNIIDAYQLDLIQLYHEDLEPFQNLRSAIKIIKALRIASPEDIKQTSNFEHFTDYFLFDTKGEKYGGNGEKFNWQVLKYYDGNKPFILSGGIGPEDVMQIQELNKPFLFGIDINSKFETRIGLKNIELIKTFKKELENDRTTITQ